jgi:hypothetical protein
MRHKKWKPDMKRSSRLRGDESSIPVGLWVTEFDEVPERRRTRAASSLFPPSAEEARYGHFSAGTILTPIASGPGPWYTVALRRYYLFKKKRRIPFLAHKVAGATVAESGPTVASSERAIVVLDSTAEERSDARKGDPQSHEADKDKVQFSSVLLLRTKIRIDIRAFIRDRLEMIS